MERVIENIKRVRQQKGYSLENMAQDLDMSISGYTKIERNETKLTVERLFKISEILETPIESLLNPEYKNIFNQELHDNSVGINQVVENLYQNNIEKIEELYVQMLQEKDKTISALQQIIEAKL